MRKLISVLLAILMLATMSVTAVAEDEEPFVITIVAPHYDESPPENTTGDEGNPVLEIVEEKCNVDLRITWAPQGDYETKFNTVMASSDQPMVMVIPSGVTTNANYIQMCQNGIFWDLTDYIQANDFFKNELTTPPCLKVTAVNNRNYLFPAIISSARVGVVYREDWLNKLELELPVNVEKFKEMVRAFTEDDPDGNGEKDTIGFAYCDNGDNELVYAGFNTLAVMLGAPNMWGLNAEGDLAPYFMFEEYYETLDLFNWMYVNGYMNNDFAINTAKHAPVENGQAGSMITTATNARMPDGRYYKKLKDFCPEAVTNVVQIMEKADGTPIINSTVSYGALGGVLIPKYTVTDEETLLKILAFFEKVQDECGINLAVGVEDLHWTRQADGSITVSDEQKQLRSEDGSDSVFSSMFPRRVQSLDYGQGLTTTQQIVARSIANEKYAVTDMSTGYIDSEFMNLQTEIAKTISDARVKYIMGEIDRAGFEAEVEKWLELGGESIIDNANENYHAANG